MASVDLKLLSKLGVTQATLKKAFTAEKPSKEIQAFKDRARERIKEAIDNNTRDYRTFWAIDKAIDSPFYQTSQSLFQGMLTADKWDSKKVLSTVNTLKEWGVGSWIKSQCGCGDGCTNGSCKTPQTVIDIPTFFEVEFPIALAYLRIRVARMYNDRNLTPLFPYYPAVSTAEERMRCQIYTQRVQMQTEQMNYRPVLRQLILQSSAYGGCILFPKEAWYCDEQPTDEMKGKKRVKKTRREGLRYDHPHPCRMYWDLAYPTYTLNSDTGCQYAGYWSLVRAGDVMDNADYWNTDGIGYGQDSFRITDNNRSFFETVYQCQLAFPTISTSTGPMTDREERMQYYTRADKDKAMLLTNHFERLNPQRDLGLKNKDGEGYDGEVWFRITIAADETVIHAEPLAYRPTTWSGYDADANRARNPSIVLECVPAQNMIHNLFSQAILQAKNNLANINFVNSDAIGQEYLDQIENFGEKTYRRPLFIPYSRKESNALYEDKRDAITPALIQKMPIAELMALVGQILNMLERTLVMSAQEIAAAATHEQSATEVVQTAQSTSTRLAYTGGFIDDAIYAWSTQLADAGLAYWDDEIFAEVALREDADRKALERLGFKVESENDAERTAGVRGSKKALDVAQFTQRRDAADRFNNVKLAAQMVQLFQVFNANPLLIQAVGVGQVVKVFNEISAMAGLPRDFRLTAINDPIKDAKEMQAKAEKQQSEQAAGEIQQLLPQIMKRIEQVQQDTIGQVGEQLKPVFEQAAQVDKQQQDQIQQLAAVTSDTKMAMEKLMQMLAPQPAPPILPAPQMAPALA